MNQASATPRNFTKYFIAVLLLMTCLVIGTVTLWQQDAIQLKPLDSKQMQVSFVTKRVTESLVSKDTQRTTTPTPTVNLKPHSTKVVILTYMRSGSSLTGDILQQDNDTFYVFEPLRANKFLLGENGTAVYMNGTRRSYIGENKIDIDISMIKGWLTCDFSLIHKHALLDSFLQFGHKIKLFYTCLSTKFVSQKRRKYQNGANISEKEDKILTERYKICLPKLQEECNNAKVRIIKTIRVYMKDMVTILKEIPGSKIINLIRDPRATMESQSHRNVCPLSHGGLPRCAQRHCGRVWNDTVVKKALLQKYPKRIHTVKYEDISTTPNETAKRLYEFVGLDFTPQIQDYVYNITIGGGNGCDVCNTNWQIGKGKTDSRKHANSWMTKLDTRYISITQMHCKKVMNKYGYEYFSAMKKQRIV